MHRFTQTDLVQATNLSKLMKKAKIELEGMEILAAADVIRWIGKLIKDIEIDLTAEQSVASVKSLGEVASPISAPPAASVTDSKPKKSRAK